MSDPNTINIPIPGGTLTISASFVPASSPSTTPTPTPAPVVVKLAIGTNVPANDVLQGVGAWCDVTRQCSGWYGVNGATLTFDANGYPATVTGGQAGSWTYLYALPSGNYTLSWKGRQNALAVQGKTIANITSDNAGGWTATVAFATGERCEFRSSGGISSVRLLSPDAVAGKTFRDAYLALLKPYKVIRLMPMQRANGVGLPPVLHTGLPRVTPAQWDQTTWEVAAEHLAELCKEAGCVPWICVPYGATDALIQDLAGVFSTLPGCIWEYGNELWNTGPAYQGNQIRNDAVKLGTFGTDPNVAGAKYHATLTAHMGQLVKAIIPSAKIVFGAQATYEAWAQNGLTSLPVGAVDALAVAPYFQQCDGDPVSTVPQVLTSCQKWIDTILAPGLTKNAAAAKAYGCAMWGYESGQSLIPNGTNAPPVELQWQADISPTQYAAYRADPMRAAQDDVGMGTLYDHLFQTCLSAGMTLACHFMVVSNWGRSGCWGARQQTTDPDTVKSQAIARAIAAGN